MISDKFGGKVRGEAQTEGGSVSTYVIIKLGSGQAIQAGPRSRRARITRVQTNKTSLKELDLWIVSTADDDLDLHAPGKQCFVRALDSQLIGLRA